MTGRLTHLSLDGLSVPLGQSQVLAVSERLQERGWECTILSLEPDPIDTATLETLRARTASRGISWQHRPYRRGRAGAVQNVASMASMVREVWRETDLFHCRSYFGAFFPAFADGFLDTPYVFDTRGYWIDEKIVAGRWFQDRASLAVARRVERELYERARGVVCLTELAAQDVRNGRFGKRHPQRRAICIPTCVNYAKFTMEKSTPPDDFLREGPIIAYVGSLNASYEYRKSLELAAMILSRILDARFLALTSQVEEMASLADEYSIPDGRRLVTRVDHDQIHRWLPWIDFGLTLLCEPNQAKRASMPTKLGEFFATGVAPITHGANSEVGDWVTRAGSGLALDDLSHDSLERAAAFVTQGVPNSDILERARQIAQGHFSLDSGADRYAELFRDVLAQA